jgi:hypothetical protein
VLVGSATAVAVVACRPAGDGTVAPEDLPPPPDRPTVEPDAFAVEGFGARLSLRRPVHLHRTDDELGEVRIVSEVSGRHVLVLHAGGAGDPAPEDASARLGAQAWVEADPGFELVELASGGEGPGDAQWRLVAADATFAWPAGLQVDAFEGPLPRVELRRFAELRDVMVIVRGPAPVEDIPGVTELVGVGQTVERSEADATPPWVELSYHFDGRDWRQRHWRIEIGGRALLLTAQAPTEHVDRVFADADAIVRSIATRLP